MTEADQDFLWQKRCRQVFALLREAGISAREERLNLFRWIVHDATISSTNDLGLFDLNLIADLLTTWKRQGELVERANEHTGPMEGRHGTTP